MPITLKFLSAVMLIASLAGCVSAGPTGSGPRTQPMLRHNQVELRIESDNWSSARIYTVSRGYPEWIMNVSPMQKVVKRVTITMAHYVFKVALVGVRGQPWVGFTEWSSSERCLNLKIEYRLSQTTVWPCWLGR